MRPQTSDPAPEVTGSVFNIQKYSLQDGPGIRTTVFLKGCPLHCAWCHNPESLSPRPEILAAPNRCIACGECRSACNFGSEIAGHGPLPPRPEPCTLCSACVDACPTGARQRIGRSMSVGAVVSEVQRDRIFHEDSGGGVTLSGGEPLSQPRFLLALLEAFHRLDTHVALDTTGFGCTEHLLDAARLADLVLYDLKAFEDARHRRLTGVSNRVILSNLTALTALGRPVWIRLPIVPGFTDDPGELGRIAAFVANLRGVELVNLLPFHRTGLPKYERLGLTHELQDVETPTPVAMEQAADPFRRLGLPTRIGG